MLPSIRWDSYFNVDGVAQGKLGLAGMGGVLRNAKEVVLVTYFKSVGVGDSNKSKILANS